MEQPLKLSGRAETRNKRTRKARTSSNQDSSLFSCVILFRLRKIPRRSFRKGFLSFASEPFAHGLPCGKRVRWSSLGRRLNNLARRDVGAPPRMASIQIMPWNGSPNVAFPELDAGPFVLHTARRKRFEETGMNDQTTLIIAASICSTAAAARSEIRILPATELATSLQTGDLQLQK